MVPQILIIILNTMALWYFKSCKCAYASTRLEKFIGVIVANALFYGLLYWGGFFDVFFK